MNCPNCQFPVEPGTSFCPQCGNPIPQQAPAQQAPTPESVQPDYGAPYPGPNYSNPQPGYYPPPQAQQVPPIHYCRNCGQQLPPGAAVCVNCGVTPGTGSRFCQTCGSAVDPLAAVCPHCGSALLGVASPFNPAKSKLVAGLLGIFLGGFGVHNFYLGFTSKAVVQLVLTIVGFFLCCFYVGIFLVAGISIWGLVEGIMILTGSIPADAKGIPLKD